MNLNQYLPYIFLQNMIQKRNVINRTTQLLLTFISYIYEVVLSESIIQTLSCFYGRHKKKT